MTCFFGIVIGFVIAVNTKIPHIYGNFKLCSCIVPLLLSYRRDKAVTSHCCKETVGHEENLRKLQ